MTARSSWAERIEGLKAGADDYLAKPFSPRELVARVRVILRRLGPKPTMIERDDHIPALPELLAELAGFQFSSNGGLGKTGSVFIRGLEARHVLLLVGLGGFDIAFQLSQVWFRSPVRQLLEFGGAKN